MSQEKTASPSPFSALSYQEQQDRWLKWRSQQLNYRAPTEEKPQENEQKKKREQAAPPSASHARLRQPNMAIAAPVRHSELDQVVNRHKAALRQAGEFQTVPIDGTGT